MGEQGLLSLSEEDVSRSEDDVSERAYGEGRLQNRGRASESVLWRQLPR